MKKVLILLLGIVLMNQVVYSQNSCSNPDTIATGGFYNFQMDTNAGGAPVGPDYGCLLTQPNPLWLFTEVCTGGNLDFLITSVGTGLDVDFICWGPISGVTNLSDLCAQVSTGTIGNVDCSYSTGASEMLNIPNAVSGEYYLILITNFSNQPGSVSINQTGGNGISCDSVGPIFQPCQTVSLPVCEVTMNDSASHCKVLWEKNMGVMVDHYYIHRLNSSNVYVVIDSIPENDSSYYVDYTSIPSSQPYRYKINFKDTCGNYSALSNAHQSIHLQASPGFNAVNLDWDSYIGLNFPTYYVMRGTDPFNMNVIDSISSAFTSYTDLNPNSAEPCYQVGFINPDPCQVTRTSEMKVVSNVFNTNPMSIGHFSEEQVMLYPNPANDLLNIELKGITTQERLIRILDASGRLVLQQTMNELKCALNIESLVSGLYFYELLEGGLTLNSGKVIVD